MLQHLGVIALALLFIIATFILLKWPPSKRQSFSENVARKPASQWLFSISFTIVTFLYYTFLAFWLGPHLAVMPVYYFLVGASFIAQLVLTWIPARGNRMLKVHTYAALVVAIIMLLLVGTMLPSLSLLQALLSGLFLLFGLVLAYLYIFVPKARRNYLLFQLVYFASFWLLILFLTYT